MARQWYYMTLCLSFDVGSKNLAYCVFKYENQTDQIEIIEWRLINLMESYIYSAAEKCGKCNLKSVFIDSGLQLANQKLCLKHSGFKRTGEGQCTDGKNVYRYEKGGNIYLDLIHKKAKLRHHIIQNLGQFLKDEIFSLPFDKVYIEDQRSFNKTNGIIGAAIYFHFCCAKLDTYIVSARSKFSGYNITTKIKSGKDGYNARKKQSEICCKLTLSTQTIDSDKWIQYFDSFLKGERDDLSDSLIQGVSCLLHPISSRKGSAKSKA